MSIHRVCFSGHDVTLLCKKFVEHVVPFAHLKSVKCVVHRIRVRTFVVRSGSPSK